MTLDVSTVVAHTEYVRAAHVLQFYNLLTGVMTDQPVLLKNRLTMTRVAGAAPSVLNYLLVTGVADTAVTAEANDVYFNLARTLQYATASVPSASRAIRIAAPTYSSVGVATLATAVTVDIDNAPQAGTNLTITNAYALRIAAGAAYFGGIAHFPAGLTFGSTSVPGIYQGSGTPEGSVTAPAGSLYLRTNGAVYIKASGSGNTGWVAIGGAINRIQAGTIALTGAASNTAAITSVDTTKAFVIYLGNTTNVSAADDFDQAMCRVELTSATVVTAYKNTSTGNCTVGYVVVEFV